MALYGFVRSLYLWEQSNIFTSQIYLNGAVANSTLMAVPNTLLRSNNYIARRYAV